MRSPKVERVLVDILPREGPDARGLHRRSRPHARHPPRGGSLAAAHPADLGAHVIKAVLDRAHADPHSIDDVIFGCVDTVGPQAGDIARTAWLAAGLPESVPGVTVDRQCGSSQQAVHFAAQAVLSGTADLVVAGGVQNMSMVPIGSAMSLVTLRRLGGLAGPLRQRGDLPVPRGRPDRGEVGDRPGGDGALRPGQPPARPAGHRGRRLPRRDRPLPGGQPRRRPPRRHHPGEDGRASSRCARAAGSPPRWPARSPTAPPPC